MKITLPSDCGNSPRMALVADLAVAWAADDKDTLEQWLADDPSWSAFGPALPETAISEVVVLGAINHGRAASCEIGRASCRERGEVGGGGAAERGKGGERDAKHDS